MRLPPVLASGQPKGPRRNSLVSSFARAPAVPQNTQLPGIAPFAIFTSPSLRLPRFVNTKPLLSGFRRCLFIWIGFAKSKLLGFGQSR